MNAKRKSNFSFYEETGAFSLHRRRHKNFYDVLGLSRDAHPDDIRAAYRAKCLLFHPDKNPTKDTTADFNMLYLAYQTLMDPELRAQYDSSAVSTTPAAEKLLAIKPDVYFRAFEKGKKMAKFGALYKQLPELEQLFELEKGKLRFLSGPPCDGGPACQPLYRLNQNLVKRLLPDQQPNTQEGGGQANELPPDSLPRVILCRNHCYLHVCDEGCTNENQEECPVFVGWLVSKWNAALVAEQQAIKQEHVANEEHDNHFQHHEAVTNPDAADWRMYESEKFPGHMFWFNHRTGEKSWRAPQFLRQEEGEEPSYVALTSTAEQASAIIPAKQEEEGAGLFNVVSGLSGLVARGVRSLFQSFTGIPLQDVVQDTTLAATTPTNKEARTKEEGPVKRKREPIAASRREQTLKKRKKEESLRQATNHRKNKRSVDESASGRKAGTDGECSPETCPPPNFARLSKNVWICRTHKRPHVCTELQCNWSGFRSNGSVECWATGRQFRYPTQTHLTAEEWRNLWGIGTGQEPPEPLEEQASPHNNIAGLLGSNQLMMGGVDSLIQSTAPPTEEKVGHAMMNAVVGGGDEGDFSTEKRRIRYVSGRSGRTIEQMIEVPIGLKLSTSAEGQSAEEQEKEKAEQKLQDNLEEIEQVSKEQDMVGLPSSTSENAHQERKPRKTIKHRPQAKLLPLSESLGLEKEISQEEHVNITPVQVDGGDKATEDENKLVLVEKLERELKEDKKDYARLLYQHRESLRKQAERKHKTAKDRAHTYGAVYLKHTSFVDVPQEDQHRAQYLQHVNEMLSHSPAMVEERQATNSRKLKELRQQLRQPHLTLDPTKEEEDEYLQDNENVYKGKEKDFAEQTISDALDFPDYGVDEEDDLFTMHGEAMDLQELQQQREEEQVNWQVDSQKEDAAYREALQRKLREIQGKKQLLLQLRSSSEQQTPLSIGSASPSSASSKSSSLPVNE